ncbi:polyamine ABC transporter substrate-binding protein [Candidatus Similichlamydia laticola]|uniref:ABC transporter, periplasmic spermidine putrescine-binding protein PotD n=1 Tax=Candidatus Similichlamydia laticola TaxID=2170265 RepID=A0A369KID5_9BACT|nr:spermidine/putrescine ABC transporter substrate-binding protein [Candidatus Similichlamydia laticola]RDB31553.1 ABC transporter, periplasmic spermidine putrescine-binding protein PotD [Candidatus Similichlamydia laticola]
MSGHYSYFESNEEMYAKIKNGTRDYDVVFCSSYFMELMRAQGFLSRLDHSKIPNISYLDRDYCQFFPDQRMEHSLPQIIGVLGIGFDKRKVPKAPDSWSVFSDWTQFRRRMCLCNDPKDVIGAALLFLGHDHNTSDSLHIEQAKDLVFKWKKNIAAFSSESYLSLESGEFIVAQTCLGYVLKVQQANPFIEFVVPKEGSTISLENLAVFKGSRNKELAFSFLNFLLSPESVTQNAALHFGFIPHKALTSSSGRTFVNSFCEHYNKVVRATKNPVISLQGEKEKLYLRAWEEIQSKE